MKYLHFLLIVAFVFSSNFCNAQLNTKEAKAIAGFAKSLQEDVIADNLHGSISTLVLKKGQIIWEGSTGYTSTKNNAAPDSLTIYRIGSITKTFTVVVLLQLVAEGKIKLDDALENYVPEMKSMPGYAYKTKITLRQLASHTSGLNREPDMKNASVGTVDEWENKVLACIPNASFNTAPGQAFLYSNIGFALLGLAMERAAGVPYIEMVKQRIFTPLHMNNSFFILPAEKRNQLAEGIDNQQQGKINLSTPVKEIEGRGYRVPNGGIFTTARDLVKFVAALTNPSPLLNAESLRQMQHVPPGGDHYGLGLVLTLENNPDIIEHDGSVPGYTAEFAIERQKDYAVILMRNYNVGQTNLRKAAHELLKSF